MEKRILKTRYIKFCFVIGFGYWKDIYLKERLGMSGITHNLIIPFFRISFGHLET